MYVTHLVDAVAGARAQGANILKRAREDAAASGPSGESSDAEKLAVASPQYKAVVAKEVEARKALVTELEKQLAEQRAALSTLMDGNTTEENGNVRKRVKIDGDGNA